MTHQMSYTISETSRKKPPGPDSLLSWTVAGGCFLVSVLIGGLNRANGILFARYVQQSGLGRELASWPFNIFGAAVFAAPLTGVIATWLPPRIIFLLGVLMYSAGIAICFVSIDVYFMIIFFGIIRGFGVTLVITLMPVFINSYFEKHRATAQGIASAGGAFGTMVFSYLIQYLLDEYSLRGSMLMIGGIALHGLIGAMVMKSPPWIASGKKAKVTKDENTEPSQDEEKKPPSENTFHRFLALAFDPMYIILILTYIFSVNFSMIYVLVITDYAADMRMSEGILLLMLYSAGELLGRLGLGWITDRQLVSRQHYLIGSYLLTGLVGGALPFSDIPAVHLVSAVVLGVSQGSNLAVTMAVLADEIQKDRLQLSVSLLRSINGLAALGRSPVIGYFRDSMGSYDHLFHSLGGLNICGAFLWLLLNFVCFIRRKQYPAV